MFRIRKVKTKNEKRKISAGADPYAIQTYLGGGVAFSGWGIRAVFPAKHIQYNCIVSARGGVFDSLWGLSLLASFPLVLPCLSVCTIAETLGSICKYFSVKYLYI